MTAARRTTKQAEQILATFMGDPTAEHSGSQIAAATNIKGGTVYPALQRMESYGWLTWRWEDTAHANSERRPRRRLYTLTGKGELAARDIEAHAAARHRERERKHNRRLAPAPSPHGLTT